MPDIAAFQNAAASRLRTLRPPGLGGLKKRKFNLNFNVDRQHQCPAASRPGKSDLRNHQAIVQPRLYDCLMVTQITLKTEGPPREVPTGCLQADRRRLIRYIVALSS